MYNTILVSLDGSLAAEAALWEVEKLLGDGPAKVVLLRVGPTVDLRQAAAEMHAYPGDTAEVSGDDLALLTYQSEAASRQYLGTIAKRLERAGAQTVIEVSFRNPAEEIMFSAHQYRVDLIVMATHGRSGMDRILHGSVTEKVLHHSSCPILIVRIPEKPLPRFAAELPETAVPSRL